MNLRGIYVLKVFFIYLVIENQFLENNKKYK